MGNPHTHAATSFGMLPLLINASRTTSYSTVRTVIVVVEYKGAVPTLAARPIRRFRPRTSHHRADSGRVVGFVMITR
jgi:hypothetical protein